MNKFNIEVNFSKAPLFPYEWHESTSVLGIKAMRVSNKTITDLLTHEATVKTTSNLLLLSDTKSAAVFKLGKSGNVTARSFLNYKDDECICEEACNLNMSKIDYEIKPIKIDYSNNLDEEKYIRDYLINSIKEIDDEDKSKYLYYLYFDEVTSYSKERLLKSIEEEYSSKNVTLYNFLIGN